MFLLKVPSILLLFINITYSMYYLTNFHAHYPDAHVIIANCSDTVSLACPVGFESNTSSAVPTMWFRLYENAYPQPLILGDRQLIDDQRFMLRTQNTNRHLEIIGVRKDDEGYYLCKSGNEIQTSYNITILSNSCIDIIPDQIHTNSDEPFQIICRVRSIENSDEVNFHVEWTRNDYLLENNLTESSSNYSSADGILYDTLTIKNATRNDTGIYKCRYGQDLVATAQIVVNHYPGGSKSRRLISQLRGNSSLSRASLRTVNFCFYIVYEIVLVALVALSNTYDELGQVDLINQVSSRKKIYHTLFDRDLALLSLGFQSVKFMKRCKKYIYIFFSKSINRHRYLLFISMHLIATLALVFCISAVNVRALDLCKGSSSDAQEEFQWKLDNAPIVVYGTATEVKNQNVTFTINCVLKGSLPVNKIYLGQPTDVLNVTECHYLAPNRNYIVFLESTQTIGAGSTTIYKFANMEEIEVNANTAKNFMDEECADQDDEGIEMTMFFASDKLQCNKFTATCNAANKKAILAQTYPPLTTGTTFLGGYKKVLGVPSENDAAISSKTNGGIGDEVRNAAAMSTISISMIISFVVLLMKFRL
ncbi:unnamed protein product [Adineta ricciae]|uniref:Ig-like domain-containing protein n=1 Tax=Adineta ricciae TaxID=249248 RepID=A0A814LRZ7_ADIRI|nr:unnamed protein product [Adineta ricciae]